MTPDAKAKRFLADLFGEPVGNDSQAEADAPPPVEDYTGEHDHIAELMGWDSPEPESEADKPVDFDGGCRTPAEPPSDPLGDHNQLMVDLANGLPPREQGGWR